MLEQPKGSRYNNTGLRARTASTTAMNIAACVAVFAAAAASQRLAAYLPPVMAGVVRYSLAPTVHLPTPRPILPALSTNRPNHEAFTYYVDSASGNDSNSGSISAPWRTIAKVNTTRLAPGQSVGFKRDGLWREMLAVRQSGMAVAPITFGAYGAGAQPIINGSDIVSRFVAEPMASVWDAQVSVPPYAVWIDAKSLGTPVAAKAKLGSQNQWFWNSGTLYVYSRGNPSSGHTVEVADRPYGIFVNQANYITLSNLDATNANDRAIYLRNCKNAVLQTITAHDSVNQAVVIGVGGGNHMISNSELYNSGLEGSFGTGSDLQILNATMPSTIDSNYFHDYGPSGGNHDVYDEGGGNTYRRNRFTSAPSARGMAMKIDVPNTTVIYNVFESIPAGGVYISNASNSRIYNNTFYNVGTASPYAAVWFEGNGMQSRVDIKNNIAYVGRGYSVGFIVSEDPVGWESDYNDVFTEFFGSRTGGAELSLSNWRSKTNQDAHSINSDPLFTNATGGDFTLRPRSPAIGAGVYIPGVSENNPPNIGAR